MTLQVTKTNPTFHSDGNYNERIGNITKITAITKANPAVVTAAGHGLSNGDTVLITGVAGMTEVNDIIFTVAGATANTINLDGINSGSYGNYTAGGSVGKAIAMPLSDEYNITKPFYNSSKKLTIFEVDFGAAVNAKTGPNSTIAQVIRAIGDVSTIVIRGDLHSTNQVMTFAIEQENTTDTFDGTNPETLVAHIEDLIQGLGTVDGINLASAAVTPKTSFNLA